MAKFEFSYKMIKELDFILLNGMILHVFITMSDSQFLLPLYDLVPCRITVKNSCDSV